MTENTLLLRQVNPYWVQDGRPTRQTFKPTAKDEGKLSNYNGDMIKADAAWQHYTGVLNLASAGVLAVSVGEFAAEQLPAAPEPEYFPEHVVVDYSAFGIKDIERKSKRLSVIAVARGWQFTPESSQKSA